MIFRRPLPADAGALASLVEELSRAQGDPTGNFTADTALRDVIGPDAPMDCLVAEADGALVGFAFWHLAYESAHALRGGFISDFHVTEAMRGKGLADALLGAVAREVAAEGGGFLWLTAHKVNERARGFYRRHMQETDHTIVAFAVGEGFERLLRE